MSITEIIDLLDNTNNKLELIKPILTDSLKNDKGNILIMNSCRISVGKIGTNDVIFNEQWYDITFSTTVPFDKVRDYLYTKNSIISKKSSNINLSIQNGTYLEFHRNLQNLKTTLEGKLSQVGVDISTVQYYTDAVSFTINSKLCRISKSTLPNVDRILFETQLNMNGGFTELNIYQIMWAGIITEIPSYTNLVRNILVCMGNMRTTLTYSATKKPWHDELINYFYGGYYHEKSYDVIGSDFNKYKLIVQRTTNTSIVVILLQEDGTVYYEEKFKRNSMNDKEKATYIDKIVSYLLE